MLNAVMQKASGMAAGLFAKLKAWVYERVTSIWDRIKELVSTKWYMVVPIAIAAVLVAIFVLPAVLPLVGSLVPFLFRTVMRWIGAVFKTVRNVVTGVLRALPIRTVA